MEQIIGYVRVSTEEQAIRGLSIEAQTAALEAWAQKNECRISKIYVDAGISARKPAYKRPALQQLLSDVQAGKGNLIVFTKLDRWFRNIAEYYKVQEVLEKHHVNWKTIHEDYDTSTASGRLKVNIMLSVAQDEADRASERIKAVFLTKREKLEPLTGNCPTGYRIEGKKLVKDPEKEAAVTAFFQKYLACGSISRAQREALENGLRIEYQLASKMLDSPAYYGYYYGVDGMTPPYITREEFDRIQQLRIRVVRKTIKNRTYLFSGIAVCGECGYHMAGRTNTRNKVPMYNCPGHYIKRSGCENRTNLSEKKIEEYLVETVGQKMAQMRTQQSRLVEMDEQKDHKQEIAHLKGKLSRLKNLYLDNLISFEEYKEDQSGIQEEISRLTALDQQQTSAPDFDKIDRLLVVGWKNMYQESSKEVRREFWQALLKEVRIYPDRHIEFDINL